MFYKENEMNAMHLGVTDQKIKKKIKKNKNIFNL